MAGRMGLEVVEVIPDDVNDAFSMKPAAARPKVEEAAENMLMLALRSLGQRALTAISDLFALVTVFSTWWIWTSIPDPNVHQLFSLGTYAAFVLAVNVIVRKL